MAGMCRNIRMLFNIDPPATDEEVYASSLQYVRKVSGFRDPSIRNRAAFEKAVVEVSKATRELMDALVTAAPSRNRVAEIARARAKAEQRFGKAANH
jgi:hypothetical protein